MKDRPTSLLTLANGLDSISIGAADRHRDDGCDSLSNKFLTSTGVGNNIGGRY